MSRVIARPVALLDGTAEPARLVEAGTDAERYYDEGWVGSKLPSFIGLLRLLSRPDTPRLGYTRVGAVANHLASVMQGEDNGEGRPAVRYGFSISSDPRPDFIELSRLEGDDTQTLAYLDMVEPTRLLFRPPDLLQTISDNAKIAELTQLLAIGQDAAEWALD